MNFVAIDVETANADMASICQIGIAKYRDGALCDEWVSLVNPMDYFDPLNISIHGITENDVAAAPTFTEVFETIRRYIGEEVCVHHTPFEKVSITRAAEYSGFIIEDINPRWLDTAKIARRTWSECAKRGYGLKPVCERFGYEFKHHDALEDAKACGHILLKAIEITEMSLEDWLARVKLPISGENTSSISRDGNPDGDLFGEVMVFTGALEISRREASDYASVLGCAVAAGITKKTTILVVGDQDVSRLAGKSKSSKHLKAEKLIKQGQNIRILRETDFKNLVATV